MRITNTRLGDCKRHELISRFKGAPVFTVGAKYGPHVECVPIPDPGHARQISEWVHGDTRVYKLSRIESVKLSDSQ